MWCDVLGGNSNPTAKSMEKLLRGVGISADGEQPERQSVSGCLSTGKQLVPPLLPYLKRGDDATLLSYHVTSTTKVGDLNRSAKAKESQLV